MEENIHLIKFKYHNGAYDIKELEKKVECQEITKEEFFEITRTYYIKDKGEG